MLFSPTLIECMVLLLTKAQIPVVVVDPVMITNQLSPKSLDVLRNQLLSIATLVTFTPNEAQILLERDIVSLDDMKRAAQDLHRLGPKYVLIKGEHVTSEAALQSQADGDENTLVVDVLFDGLHFTVFKSPHVSVTNVYGTRSTLSAAITAYLACGLEMIRAIHLAISYTHSTVQNSLASDHNHGTSNSNIQLLVNEAPKDSVCQTETSDSPVIKKEQQQTSNMESGDKVVIVSSQCWIHEPRILLQKRSFVQLLKNECLQHWVCILCFFSCIFLRGE
jgi:hydroxymethylpyrimidine kinase/phosphomethylpyrimidine kinase